MRPYDPQVIEAFLGRFYGDKALQILPYGYTVTFTGMTAALASTQQLNIAANADFVLMGLRYRAHDTSLQENSTKTAAFGRVLITDSGTNEQFTNAAVPGELCHEQWRRAHVGLSPDHRRPLKSDRGADHVCAGRRDHRA